MGHPFDGDNTVQVCQGRAEQSVAEHLRAHCRTNKVGRETYREGGYNRLGDIAVNSEEHQKD